MLVIQDVSFSYDENPVLQGIDLMIEKEEIVVLIGPSGSGKTTLFHLITGLLSPSSGTISIEGTSGEEARNLVGYMMQEDLLLPWRSILRNVLLPFEIGSPKLDLDVARLQARNILDEVKLSHTSHMLPGQLSGGMRQRVSLARTLLQNRPLLLLDEPFGSLDVHLREEMHAFLRKMSQQHRTTIFMITHDFRDAISLADRIILLGEGKITNEWFINSQMREDPKTVGELILELSSTLRSAHAHTF